MQAAKKLASKKLIDVALLNVRRRFLDLTTRQFAPESFEFDTVQYRSKRIFDGTVTGGKNARALLALEAFQALNPEADTAEIHKMAEFASVLEMVGAIKNSPSLFKRSQLSNMSIFLEELTNI
ncbi:unnamed protein product [Strongylus vulgaris]|uniref:Uncharacterized protein n=1 Tax=Strongylus vulgaris TaxID=40348 RepID=A0A3P7K3X0_STRVU|nr:unnamed protein product [Strongylus vulgaris]